MGDSFAHNQCLLCSLSLLYGQLFWFTLLGLLLIPVAWRCWAWLATNESFVMLLISAVWGGLAGQCVFNFEG